MKKDEALNVIRQACVEFRGTLQDHRAIQEALAFIAKELDKGKEKPKKSK